MKALILLISLSLLSPVVFAQMELKEANVPESVRMSLKKLYPEQTLEHWVSDGEFYYAELKTKGIEKTITLADNGRFIKEDTEIPPSDLPKEIREYFSKNTPGLKITEATKIVDAEGTITYEADVEKMRYIFDSKGIYLAKNIKSEVPRPY